MKTFLMISALGTMFLSGAWAQSNDSWTGQRFEAKYGRSLVDSVKVSAAHCEIMEIESARSAGSPVNEYAAAKLGRNSSAVSAVQKVEGTNRQQVQRVDLVEQHLRAKLGRS